MTTSDRPAKVVGLVWAGAWAAVLAFFAVLDAIGNLGVLDWVKAQFVASNRFGQVSAITTLTLCLVVVGLVTGGRQWKHQLDARLRELKTKADAERESLTAQHRDELSAQAAQHEQLTRELEVATATQVAAARGDTERRRRECESDVNLATARLQPLAQFRERLDHQAGYGRIDLEVTTAVEVILDTLRGPEPIYDQRLGQLLNEVIGAAGRYNSVMEHEALLSGRRGEDEPRVLAEASNGLVAALDAATARLHELRVDAGIPAPLRSRQDDPRSLGPRLPSRQGPR